MLTSPVQSPAVRRKQVEALEQEANDLERELVKRSTSFAEEKRLARTTWREVQKTLRPGEATVEFAHFRFFDGKRLTDKRYYVALIVTPETIVAPVLIVLGEAKDIEAVPLNDYREQMQLRGPPGTAASGPSAAAAPLASSLYAAIWKPLEPVLARARRVYLSPDSVLNQISWAVLPRSDGKLLIETVDLRVVNSTKDLLREPHPPVADAAVLIGNPQFDLSEAEQRAAIKPMQPRVEVASAISGTGGQGLRSRDLRGGALKPLPGTQAEVEAVSSLLKQQRWSVQTYTQQNAVEERVKRVDRPRVLHLATHGFFYPDQPQKLSDLARMDNNDQPSGLEDPMLRSGLFLAGANRALEDEKPAADLDDGILTAYEATQLNVQGTELVVLSACDTGLGTTQAGEGVFGLRRAF